MSLDVFQAVVAGYGDALLDQQILAVQSGYWSAYYAGVKHPKPVSKVAEEMINKHQKMERDAKKISTPKPDVDVAAFLEMEAAFQSRLAQAR